MSLSSWRGLFTWIYMQTHKGNCCLCLHSNLVHSDCGTCLLSFHLNSYADCSCPHVNRYHCVRTMLLSVDIFTHARPLQHVRTNFLRQFVFWRLIHWSPACWAHRARMQWHHQTTKHSRMMCQYHSSNKVVYRSYHGIPSCVNRNDGIWFQHASRVKHIYFHTGM